MVEAQEARGSDEELVDWLIDYIATVDDIRTLDHLAECIRYDTTCGETYTKNEKLVRILRKVWTTRRDNLKRVSEPPSDQGESTVHDSHDR